MQNFSIEADGSGLAIATFDVPGRSMNTLTTAAVDDLAALAERIATDNAITGVVIISGKSNGFCAGADLDDIQDVLGRSLDGPADAAERLERLSRMSRAVRKIERCGKPVAVAIEGLALGGGLELALAAHYRVATNDPKVQLGLPEAKIGLMPGAGGTQRLPRLIGIAAALPYLIEGKSMSAAEGLKLGLVDELAAPGEAVAAARKWVAARSGGEARWDRKGFRYPGGEVNDLPVAQAIGIATAAIRKSSAKNYPAPVNILKAVYEGCQVPIDAALALESRYFVDTLSQPQARAMVRSLFVSPQALAKGDARPKDVPALDPVKVGVLGAGMMGAGIAYVQAMAGITTVLLDTSIDAAQRGKDYSRNLLDRAVKKGQITATEAEIVLGRITPTTDYADLKGSDLVVEAVFEDRTVKAQVTRLAEAQLAPDVIFASNTSTLPISGLAEASERPANFIGLHFFSPVDRMALVEVILGKQTSPETLARALDYVKKIRKTPIVVNDSRGFYTSRCFATFIYEGAEMLREGIPPTIIENGGRTTGMPRAPLEMFDDVALDLDVKIRTQTATDLGDAYVRPEMADIIDKMVHDHNRLGRKNGKGFYDYPDDGQPKTLWSGLADLAPPATVDAPAASAGKVRERLLYRQAIEAARCVDEGVVNDPRSADVGAILAWGFAPWTGGPLSLIDMVGVPEFTSACDRLADELGERFRPPQLLRDMAAQGRTFYA